MMEWSIIAWHVTTHCYVAVLRCNSRIVTCMVLLQLALTAEKKLTPVGFAIRNIAVPQGHIVRTILTRI